MPPSSHTNADKSTSTASRAAAVQTRLSVGPTNDSYEQEADRVAGRVVNTGPGVGPAASSGDGSSAAAGSVSVAAVPTISRLVRRRPGPAPQTRLQRQAEEEEPQARVQRQAEEEEPQASIQRQAEEEEPQASVQRQAEEEEPQASVQRQAEEEEPQASIQRQAEEEEPQASIQRQAEEEEPQASIQRQAEEEEPQASVQRQAEEEEPQANIQRQAEEEEPQASLQRRVDARSNVRDKRMYPKAGRVENKIFDSKGKGEPLPDDTRVEMETQFRADFSGVRVHTGGDAEQMNRELRAQAFAHGSDLFFNAGKYEPDSVRGKELLAHELTHVVQQGAVDQKLSEDKVRQNNAKKDQPPPEPTDKKTQQIEQETKKAKEERDTEIEQPAETAEKEVPSPGPEGGAGKAAEGEGEKKPEGEGEGEKAAGAEGEKKEKKAEKPQAEKKGAPPKKKKAGEKEKAGEGAGAYLRKTTQATVEQKKAKVEKLAADKKKKDPADEKLKQTQKAVEPPAEEGQSRANATQVETVDKEPEPEPDKEEAKKEFDQALESSIPNSLEAVDEFKEEGKGRVVGEKITSVVTKDTQDIKETYKKVEDTPEPAPPEQTPEELPEVEPAPELPPLDMGDGVVGEVKPEHTDLSEFEKESDEMLEKEGITEEQLEMVDEGDLAEAKKDRKTVKEKVQTGPKEVEKLQQEEKQKVDADLKKEEAAGKKEMQAERQKELKGAKEDQKKTKSKIELKRQAVTDHINAIYETTNKTVQNKLDNLEKQSLKAFDQGQAQATKTFEDNVKRRIDAFKDRRYSGWTGPFKWAKDKLLGMEDLPEVTNIFDSEKSRFVTAIDKLVAKITADNEKVIQECKDLIAAAKQKIQEYVDGLGPELRETGQQALTDMKSKLDALDKKVEEKAEELKQKLAEKREAAIKAIEEKIEKMKSEMSGLVGKLGALLLAAALKFFKWALKKVAGASEQVMGILNKGQTVLEKIVKDPVAFIKNIVTAVKTGINNFVTNIKKHLIGGLISWLTGAMADVPIQLPDKWDVKGILYLILQILGLTWDRIRAKLVKRLGERVVSTVEKTVDIVKKLVTEGPMALWEMIKEKAAEIKEQVMSGIRDWVVTQVVKQAVIKLVSFLNPAGAILQAILAIYNTVMFFIENWDRIVEFVKTVINSISDIAMGKISAAAQAVEKAMAMTIPVILNFLARLIGLGSIGKTVTKIIKKIRRPIDKVVDKVIDKVVGYAKKLLRKAKKGVGKLKDKAVAAIQWWRTRKSAKDRTGASHTLTFKGRGTAARLVIRSQETALETYLANASGDPGAIRQAKKKLGQVKTITRSKVKPAEAQRITVLLTEISGLLAKIAGSTPDEIELPKKAEWKYGGGAGKYASVEKLSTQTATGGSDPGSSAPNGWSLLTRNRLTEPDKGQWVRMHMISAAVGGKGKNNNLVPAPSSINTGAQVSSFENAVKGLLGQTNPATKKKNVIWVKTQVTQFHPASPGGPVPYGPTDFVHRVSMKSGLHFPEKSKEKIEWKKDAAARVSESVEIPTPDFSGAAKPSINTHGRKLIRDATGCSVRFAMYVVEERTTKDLFPANNVARFRKRMLDYQRRELSAASPEFTHNLALVENALRSGNLAW